MKAKKILALAAAVLTMSCVSVPVFAETDPFTTHPIRIEQQEKEGFKLSDNILTKTDKSGTYGYTGKVKIGGKTKFYDNGVRWTGWRKIKGKWYYFDPDNDGIMAEEKAKTALGYYYFDENGAWNGKLSKSAKYPDDFEFMMSDLTPDPISGCEINTYEGLIKAPDEYNDNYSRKIKLSKRDKQIFYDVIMNCSLSEIKNGLYARYLYEINADSFGEDDEVVAEITDASEYTTKFTVDGKTYEIHGGYEMYDFYSYENSGEVRNYAYFLAFARRYIWDTPQYAKIAEANRKALDKAKKYPALTALTEEQENKLKEDFIVYKSNKWTDAKSEEMFIMRYYGTYNGNEVVVMWRSEYDTTSDLKEVTVGNRTFILESGSYEILLHKNSGFIDINTAYAEGYLTDEDIEAIYYYYANNKI